MDKGCEVLASCVLDICDDEVVSRDVGIFGVVAVA